MSHITATDTLTKAKLVEHVSGMLGLSKSETEEIVIEFYEQISKRLENGERVKLSGFGKFVLLDKDERPGRNPKTGEVIPVSARRVVTFRPGNKLLSRVEKFGNAAESEGTESGTDSTGESS